MTDLQIGDKVATTFNRRLSYHEVTKVNRTPKNACQSGIMVKVKPYLCYDDEWVDSDWFTKVNNVSGVTDE